MERRREEAVEAILRTAYASGIKIIRPEDIPVLPMNRRQPGPHHLRNPKGAPPDSKSGVTIPVVHIRGSEKYSIPLDYNNDSSRFG